LGKIIIIIIIIIKHTPYVTEFGRSMSNLTGLIVKFTMRMCASL